MISKIYPVTCHTDHVGPGSTFVAIKGFTQDGHNFIKEAIGLGATKIFVEKNLKLYKKQFPDIEFHLTNNSRNVLAKFSARALDNPCSKLKIIGITGTKGKTSTTYIIESILKYAGFKTALIGTIKNKILDQTIPTNNTTPESDYLQMFFDQCVKNGVEYVVMEVSSHALSLHRTHGIKFDAISFNNLAPEHLDFYNDMQNYFQAKSLIFKQIKNSGSIIINKDDEWGKKALEKIKFPQTLTLQKSNHKERLGDKNYSFSIIKNNLNGLEFKIQNSFQEYTTLKSNHLFGEFNVYNLVTSFLICKQLGINEQIIKDAIKKFSGIPGRLQMFTLKNGAKAFVDYAHNPSSMEAVLKTLKTLSNDLIVVFGCGGNRDKTKRPVMGKLAEQYANKIIITDDNPRNENSLDIANNILKGIDSKKQKNIILELERRNAIKKAVEISNKNSVIAILGKGHENYHLVKDKKFHLDDFEEISKY